jgi:protein-S-isoprenylcysteine O-methyltransferase Ste14
MDISKLKKKIIRRFFGFYVLWWIVVFTPSWTLYYWQGWIYWLIFLCSSVTIITYFLKKDPTLLERRSKSGPIAEKRTSQKIIQGIATFFTFAAVVISVLDVRFNMAQVPVYVIIISDFIIFLGFCGVFRVFKENSFAAATIQVGEKQQVISTGPYSHVRHPMYSAVIFVYLFTPLALGSYIGLILAVLVVASIIFRLLDEEKFLSKNLEGYCEYCRKVPYRLIPSVW